MVAFVRAEPATYVKAVVPFFLADSAVFTARMPEIIVGALLVLVGPWRRCGVHKPSPTFPRIVTWTQAMRSPHAARSASFRVA